MMLPDINFTQLLVDHFGLILFGGAAIIGILAILDATARVNKAKNNLRPDA